MKPSFLPYILAACVLVTQFSGYNASPLPQSPPSRHALSNLEVRGSNDLFIKDGHESLAVRSQSEKDLMMRSGDDLVPSHTPQKSNAPPENLDHSSHSSDSSRPTSRASSQESDSEGDVLYMRKSRKGHSSGDSASAQYHSGREGSATTSQGPREGRKPSTALSESSFFSYLGDPENSNGEENVPLLPIGSSQVLPNLSKDAPAKDRRGSDASQGKPLQSTKPTLHGPKSDNGSG
ncbi:hypothetical protein H0H93_006182 [Arthromyces matolae]|nr:hypothetical protein H0H93_006182 [Arthromyces matolae]